MPRRPVSPETLVRDYRTHTVWLPSDHPEWWALYDAAPPDARRELMEAPPPVARRVWIVTWRLPFGVRGVDVRYFRDWRRGVAHRGGRVLLAVELEGPAGDTSKERDPVVQAQLDELSWVIERLWLASADAPFERPLRALRPARPRRAADDDAARPSTGSEDDRTGSTPPAAADATGLILLRPDGATMLGTSLAPRERDVLDLAVGAAWLTAIDVRRALAARGIALDAVEASRLLERLRAAGVLHPAERRPGEDDPPDRAPGDRGPVRLHRSALHAATYAMLASLDRREVPSRFSQRRALLSIHREAFWANRLRARLRDAGLFTV